MLRLVEPAPLYKAAILVQFQATCLGFKARPIPSGRETQNSELGTALDAVAEMQAVGEWDISPEAFAARFDDMLRELDAAKDPATAPPGVLPHEDFWLIEQDTWIGLLTLRLQLNERFLHSGGHIGYMVRPSKRRSGYGTILLRLGLDKAGERGFQRVLLTCDETNIGSRKIIEPNGGQFENAVVVAGHDGLKLRYWISLD